MALVYCFLATGVVVSLCLAVVACRDFLDERGTLLRFLICSLLCAVISVSLTAMTIKQLPDLMPAQRVVINVNK